MKWGEGASRKMGRVEVRGLVQGARSELWSPSCQER